MSVLRVVLVPAEMLGAKACLGGQPAVPLARVLRKALGVTARALQYSPLLQQLQPGQASLCGGGPPGLNSVPCAAGLHKPLVMVMLHLTSTLYT